MKEIQHFTTIVINKENLVNVQICGVMSVIVAQIRMFYHLPLAINMCLVVLRESVT
jgi:hypothetical protein